VTRVHGGLTSRFGELWLVSRLHLLFEEPLLNQLGCDLECEGWYRHAPPF
jgi:hypothetical protein